MSRMGNPMMYVVNSDLMSSQSYSYAMNSLRSRLERKAVMLTGLQSK